MKRKRSSTMIPPESISREVLFLDKKGGIPTCMLWAVAGCVCRVQLMHRQIVCS